jgi:BirA family biotin operon repressor/biotin-[acetyl-CoA-carboxylase] ligase
MAQGPAIWEPPPGARERIARTRFGEIRRFDTVDSTNRYLVDEARAGAPEGTVAVAGEQTAGRGRLDRSWEAPPGSSLLVSVLLRPALPADDLPLLVAAAALAGADAVHEVAGLDARLKWPNDLVVGEEGRRKLGGVLAETAGTAVVVGFGCNVSTPSFPDHLPDATSIALESSTVPAVDDLLVAWLVRFDARLEMLRLDRAALVHALASHSATIGKRVRVERAGAPELVGEAVGLSERGHLLVDDGTSTIEVLAGDVVHLRAV